MFSKDKPGFMQGLFAAFLEELTDKEKDRFVGLPSQEDKAVMVLGHPFIGGKLNNLARFDRKNGAKSASARNEGNQLFQSGKFREAVIKYSIAVAFAAHDKPEYSLALANRSAALQRLNLHQKALVDVELAIQANYPEDKLYKVYERKGQCLRQLARRKEAKSSFQKAAQLVSKSALAEDKQTAFIVSVKQQVSSGCEDEPAKDADREEQQQEGLLTLVSPHPMYPSMCDKVQVRYTPEKGRHLVADSLIPAGTVVLQEEPITWSLNHDKAGSHCQHCLSPVTCIIPCPGCCAVSFCSIACRDSALSLYHTRECGLVGVLSASGLNNFGLMAVRSLVRNKFSELRQRYSTLGYNSKQGTTEDGMKVYDPSDLANMLNLVHHDEDATADEMLLTTLVSVFLARCLVGLTQFVEEEEAAAGPDKGDETFLSCILYRLLSSFPANTHEIGYLQTPVLDKWTNLANYKPLGSGLYLTAALFNHSCDPNIMRCNSGRLMTSVACRDIHPGQEIFDCYGLPWYMKPKKERQEVARKFYKFECACPPCLEDWPLSSQLAASSLGSLARQRCSSCGAAAPAGGACAACGQRNDPKDLPLAKILGSCDEAVRLLTFDAQWAAGVGAVRRAAGLLDQHLVAPTKEYYNLQIGVWRSIWVLSGSKRLTKAL